MCTQVITQKRLLTPIEMTERFPRFFVRVFTKRKSEECFPFLANFRSRCRNVAETKSNNSKIPLYCPRILLETKILDVDFWFTTFWRIFYWSPGKYLTGLCKIHLLKSDSQVLYFDIGIYTEWPALFIHQLEFEHSVEMVFNDVDAWLH